MKFLRRLLLPGRPASFIFFSSYFCFIRCSSIPCKELDDFFDKEHAFLTTSLLSRLSLFKRFFILFCYTFLTLSLLTLRHFLTRPFLSFCPSSDTSSLSDQSSYCDVLSCWEATSRFEAALLSRKLSIPSVIVFVLIIFYICSLPRV